MWEDFDPRKMGIESGDAAWRKLVSNNKMRGEAIRGRRKTILHGTIAVPNPRGELKFGTYMRIVARSSDGRMSAVARGIVVDFDGDYAVIDFDSRKNPPGYG